MLHARVSVGRSTLASTGIAGFLARVRTLVVRQEAVRVGASALACLLALALVLPLAGHALGESRTTTLVLGVVAIVVAVGLLAWGIVLGAVVPRRRYTADAAVARWVGTRHPAIASDLLSAVELATAPPRPGAPSPALVGALLDATEGKLVGIVPAALLPRAAVLRARRYLAAALVANLALVGFAPGLVAEGWARLVSAPPPPFDGAKLSVVPLVGDLDAKLAFPAYAKRPLLDLPSSSGDLRGLPGTQVAIHARVLVPAQAAELVLEPDGTAPARSIPAKLEGDQLSTELVIDRSTHYRFAITAPDGSRSIETTPRVIEAEVDHPPAVQLMAPADPLDVTNLRRVELAYILEDDFGLASAELVWESGKDHGKKPLNVYPDEPASAASSHPGGSTHAQGKLLWDIAELNVPSGGDVRYWIEAKDTDSVNGPNVGRSREMHLRVISPRERHEETLARQEVVAEKLVRNLGGRLTGPGPTGGPAGRGAEPEVDATAREELDRALRESIVELGALAAAFDKDPHASDALRKSLAGMRDRLDRQLTTAQHLVPKGKTALKGAYANVDKSMIAELEDDVLALADWLDRERLEGLLDISDEIAAHQKRLKELLADYARTKDPRVLDEIEREMRALDRGYAELEKHRRGMPEDVLDQYVHQEAAQAQAQSSCVDEVRKLVHAGQTAQAQAKLEQCRQQHERSQSALEGSLASYRGDRFTDEQKKLDEVMNELADVAKDQDDIAAEANRIFEQYAEKADDVARGNKREASKKVGALVEKLRKRIGEIKEAGLTPFAKEELDVVERRLGDVEHMVGDGDLAEALGMATQAKASLDTIAGELEAAMNDDPKSKWADATQEALEGVERAAPVAKELIDELSQLSPRPDQIMSAEDQKGMERLRRREAMTKDRAKRLGERTKQLGGDLPGDAAQELGKKLGGAVEQMGQADERMKGKDPSGTREATRSAADALAKARDRARSAARQAQEGTSAGDEPIRIPGADEYKAPEAFRKDLLDAMEKKGEKPPEGYGEMIKEYYKELVK